MAANRTPDFTMDGRLALVSAGSRGIGAAVATALAQYGADVGINYFGEAAEAEAVADTIRAAGRRAWTFNQDLGDPAAPAATVAWLKAAAGRPIDIIVSGAALQIEEDWRAVTADHADAHWALNLRGSFLLVQAALPDMIDRGWGRVVTVGSVQEISPVEEMVVYASLKAAQANLVRNLAKQVAASGVTVNNIAPGMVATPRNAGSLATPELREAARQRIPVGFIADAEDIAGAAVYLCSDAARYVTGSTILVDGGWSL